MGRWNQVEGERTVKVETLSSLSFPLALLLSYPGPLSYMCTHSLVYLQLLSFFPNPTYSIRSLPMHTSHWVPSPYFSICPPYLPYFVSFFTFLSCQIPSSAVLYLHLLPHRIGCYFHPSLPCMPPSAYHLFFTIYQLLASSWPTLPPHLFIHVISPLLFQFR